MSEWIKVLDETTIPVGLGGCIKHNEQQIALFHYSPGEWYALENRCPHTKKMVISRGLTGDSKGEAKIACPMHKNQFSLATGRAFNPDLKDLKTFPVKLESGSIYLQV